MHIRREVLKSCSLYSLVVGVVLAVASGTFAQQTPPDDPTPCGAPGQAQCNDGNSCTDDVCVNGFCQYNPRPNGSACDDWSSCTDDDYCLDGVCVGTIDCDDQNECTADACEWVPEFPWYVTACFHYPVSGSCDDGDPCTQNDQCDIMGNCVGTPLQCDDSNPCTDDECVAGVCTYTPNTASCNDGDICTVGDACAGGVCQGSPLDCDDGDPCTIDDCDSSTIGCTHEDMDCDDANPCTADSCDNGVCQHGLPDCEDDNDTCGPGPYGNFYGICANCTITLSVPTEIPVNCDDDNNNSIPDYQEPGPITGENDLQPLSVSFSGNCPGLNEPEEDVIWHICEGQGNRTYRVYENSDKTNPLDHLSGWHSWPPPSIVYLEGIAVSDSNCPSRVIFWMGATYPAGGICIYCGYEGDQTTVTGAPPDIDGDGDHDGVVTNNVADEVGEDELPGVIVLCNVDDDDEDGVHDGMGANKGTIDDGPNGNDYEDLAPVVLRGPTTLPLGWTVVLSLHTPENVAPGVSADGVVRVFSARAAGAAPLLGPPPQSNTFELPQNDPNHDADLAALAIGDVTLGVEGLEFAARVKLKMALHDQSGTLVCWDEIQLKVAPLLLIPHSGDPTDSYVARVSGFGQESDDYCDTRFPDATPPGVTDHVIESGLNNGTDQWVQDEIQIGFQEAPYKSMYVVLDSQRDRELDAFAKARSFDGGLFGPDFGHIQVPGIDPVNDLDSFGNLDVAPAGTYLGIGFQLGRIYYGTGQSRQMDDGMRSFLDRQHVQLPAFLDSDWLWVGHVDEFMSIIPDPTGTYGWKVLLADSDLAVTTLLGVDPVLHIPRYTSGYGVTTVGQLLAKQPTSLPTPGGSQTIQTYNMAEVDPQLTALKNEIIQQFGLSPTDVIRVPVLFDHIGPFPGGAIAITPGVANGAVYGGVYIAPDTFIHTEQPNIEEDANQNWQLDPGEDANNNQMLDTFRDPFHVELDGKLPGGITAKYIDDWHVYHLQFGEVHCSSNEIRAIPASPKWWDTVLGGYQPAP